MGDADVPTLPPTAEGTAWTAFAAAFADPTESNWEHALALIGSVALVRFATVALEASVQKVKDLLCKRERVVPLTAEEETALVAERESTHREHSILTQLWKDMCQEDRECVQSDPGRWIVKRWGLSVASAVAWSFVRFLFVHVFAVAVMAYMLWAIPSVGSWATAARLSVGAHTAIYSWGVVLYFVRGLSGFLVGSSLGTSFACMFILPTTSCLYFPFLYNSSHTDMGRVWDAAVEFEMHPMYDYAFTLLCLIVLPERVVSLLVVRDLCFMDICCFMGVLLFAEPWVSVALWGSSVFVPDPQAWIVIALTWAVYGVLSVLVIGCLRILCT